MLAQTMLISALLCWRWCSRFRCCVNQFEKLMHQPSLSQQRPNIYTNEEKKPIGKRTKRKSNGGEWVPPRKWMRIELNITFEYDTRSSSRWKKKYSDNNNSYQLVNVVTRIKESTNKLVKQTRPCTAKLTNDANDWVREQTSSTRLFLGRMVTI